MASLSSVGVGTTPPKAEFEPNPASSIRIRSTFGAPSGGMTVGGQPGLLLTKFGAMKPLKGGVGVGSTVLSGNWLAVGDCACAEWRSPTAPSAPRSAPLAVDKNS